MIFKEEIREYAIFQRIIFRFRRKYALCYIINTCSSFIGLHRACTNVSNWLSKRNDGKNMIKSQKSRWRLQVVCEFYLTNHFISSNLETWKTCLPSKRIHIGILLSLRNSMWSSRNIFTDCNMIWIKIQLISAARCVQFCQIEYGVKMFKLKIGKKK